MAGTADPGSTNMIASCTTTWGGEGPVTDGAKQKRFPPSRPRNERRDWPEEPGDLRIAWLISLERVLVIKKIC